MHPVLLILVLTGGAALAAPLGALPFRGRRRPPRTWLGAANSLAAGFMLGSAVVLAQRGLDHPPLPGALGALGGIALVFLTHRMSGVDDLDLNRVEDAEPDYGYRVLFVAMFHSAIEGVAIGAAMWVSVPLGIAVALTMAIHNVPEGMVLAAVLRASGVSVAHAGRLTATSNVGQVFLAISTYAVIDVAPAITPAVHGAAVGALLFLVMSDLLPQAYRQSGHNGIAVAASIAMGMVVFLGSVLP